MKKTGAALLLALGLGMAGGAAQAEVLQTQMGMQGQLEADVIKAKVDGNILTVAIMFRNQTDREVRRNVPLKETFFIDDKGEKKYFVLRDAKGAYVAGPKNPSNGYFMLFSVAPKGKAVVWMKFPAPPAGTTTINLSFPSVMPFDGLKVQR